MDLHLLLKGEYFDQIKSGMKVFEYRQTNPYWSKRLIGREYDNIVLTRGYPRRDDCEKRLVLPYTGYRVMDITHPHFGPDPVEVFAIDVRTP